MVPCISRTISVLMDSPSPVPLPRGLDLRQQGQLVAELRAGQQQIAGRHADRDNEADADAQPRDDLSESGA
jgi:hypothetical protein